MEAVSIKFDRLVHDVMCIAAKYETYELIPSEVNATLASQADETYDYIRNVNKNFPFQKMLKDILLERLPEYMKTAAAPDLNELYDMLHEYVIEPYNEAWCLEVKDLFDDAWHKTKRHMERSTP